MTGASCCNMECSVITWKCPVKSGVIYAVGNMLLLSLYCDVPLLAYVLSYGGLLLLAAGAAVKLGKFIDPSMLNLENVLTKEQVEEFAGKAYACVNCLSKQLLPIALWENLQTSGAALVILYFASGLFSWISISMLLFLAWNVVFVYGKFQNQINPLVCPHLATAKALVEQTIAKIPKYQKPGTAAKKDE